MSRPPRHAVFWWGSSLVLAQSTLLLVAATQPPADADQHWAFHLPKSTSPPNVLNPDWPRTDIDRFILAKLEALKLEPGPQAGARTLIRRMTFDLTGLPPTPEEVEQFIGVSTQDRATATAELIERLLASPRYGERWGRHWLDVARYSDTKGYVYSREERHFVHAPTYRDWVIRSFNQDLPYDRFLLLQIAADQLVPPDSHDLAAMGFVTGGRRFIGVTHDIIDDRIDVVTRGAMGLTVQCARCHDHKYDPIPTRDYYALYGVFHGSDDRLIPLESSEDAELAKRRQKLAETMALRRDEAGERLRSRMGEYLAAQFELAKYPEEGFDQIFAPDDLMPASVRRWRDFLQTTRNTQDPIFGPWHLLASLTETEFQQAGAILADWIAGGRANPLVASVFRDPPGSMQEVAGRYGDAFAQAERDSTMPGAAELRAFLRDPRSPTVVPDTSIVNNEGFFPTSVVEDLWKLQGEVERRLIELGTPAALVLMDREPEPNPRVFNRGNPSLRGDEVPRQFLEVLAGPKRAPFRCGSGRLELAQAIATANNPLTARVMVNRIWQHHFGAGLVRTPSDFGLRAETPSHPELLDWLALRFIAEGWSVKAMHRLILSSAVYQTTSQPPPVQAALSRRPTDPPQDSALVDPDDRLLVRFPIHRLDFEQLRDSMLAVGGELDPRMGGKPAGLTDVENRRRTVYAMVDRQYMPGTFRTFDFANPDIHVAVRHETIVPQQALYFLNGVFVARRAKALATLAPDAGPESRVQRLFQRVYQRPATPHEVDAALRFIRTAGADPPPPPPPPRQTAWKYGFGEYDASAKRLKSFDPLPHFSGSAWQGAESWPGGDTGWAQITAEGGHPGNTLAQACVRRWIAPRDATVSLAGTIRHEPEQGDGVRAFVLSSRQGELKEATVHHTQVEMTVMNLEIKAGDTLDFVVDIGGTLHSDQFLWVPVVTAEEETWDARADFAGPTPTPQLLSAWEQLAQVLLLSNEFAFVD